MLYVLDEKHETDCPDDMLDLLKDVQLFGRLKDHYTGTKLFAINKTMFDLLMYIEIYQRAGYNEISFITSLNDTSVPVAIYAWITIENTIKGYVVAFDDMVAMKEARVLQTQGALSAKFRNATLDNCQAVRDIPIDEYGHYPYMDVIATERGIAK